MSCSSASVEGGPGQAGERGMLMDHCLWRGCVMDKMFELYTMYYVKAFLEI